MRTRILPLAAGLLAAAAAGAQAQAVDVSFAPKGRFTDAGETPHDVARTEAELSAHLQSLGQRLLPAGSKLKVVVTEIDLAGDIPRRQPTSPRVLTGQADRPRLELRYEFTRADGQVEPGEATLSDLSYLDRRLSTTGAPLPYEKRLIEEWLRQRFASGTAPG
jgi:hypothetical protein